MNTFDNTQAREEGWELLMTSMRGPIIWEFYDDMTCRLPGYSPDMSPDQLDALALAFVQQKAAEGSAYHIEALAICQLTQ